MQQNSEWPLIVESTISCIYVSEHIVQFPDYHDKIRDYSDMNMECMEVCIGKMVVV